MPAVPDRRKLLLLALPALLSGCAVIRPGAPLTPLERAANGLYEGEGRAVVGGFPYRLTLTLQEGSGKASGVLLNLFSLKAYTGSGTFKRTAEGGLLDMNFYEEGNRFRAALHGEWKGDLIVGPLRTVLLGKEMLTYNLTLKKVQPVPAQTP